MRLVYGLDVAERNDKHISLAERGVDIFIKIMIPGRYLVEAIPVLRHIPTWFPGASFKRDASAWKEEVLALRDEPFRVTQEQIVCIYVLAQEPLFLNFPLEYNSRLRNLIPRHYQWSLRNLRRLARWRSLLRRRNEKSVETLQL